MIFGVKLNLGSYSYYYCFISLNILFRFTNLFESNSAFCFYYLSFICLLFFAVFSLSFLLFDFYFIVKSFILSTNAFLISGLPFLSFTF
jgi:hypothetical protein